MNMVKENDTWQFANCHFWFQRSSTLARPTHLHIAEILSDSRFLMEGRELLLLSPTRFSCLLRYRPETFLPPGINLPCAKKGRKKNHIFFAIWVYLSIKYPGEEVLAAERVRLPRLSNVCVWGGVGRGSNWPVASSGDWSKWIVVKNLVNNFGGRREEKTVSSHLISQFEQLASFSKVCVAVTWLQFKFLLRCQRSKHYPSILPFLLPFDSPPSAPSRVGSKRRSVNRKTRRWIPSQAISSVFSCRALINYWPGAVQICLHH